MDGRQKDMTGVRGIRGFVHHGRGNSQSCLFPRAVDDNGVMNNLSRRYRAIFGRSRPNETE